MSDAADSLAQAPSGLDAMIGVLMSMSPQRLAAVLSDIPERSALWVRAAAEYGLAEGQVAYGRLLLEGRGVAKDAAAALSWFGKAAKAGDADAQNMVGRCLENGWGAPADAAQAAQWYDRAARAGHDWAQYNLGHLYLDGLGVERDVVRGFGLYRAAADQGHVRAMNLVARCYEQGWGVAADFAMARGWTQRSAEGGYFRGQYNFGLMLAEEGDLVGAVAWMGKALACAPAPSRAVMAEALAARPELPLAAIGQQASAQTVPQPCS